MQRRRSHNGGLCVSALRRSATMRQSKAEGVDTGLGKLNLAGEAYWTGRFSPSKGHTKHLLRPQN